MVATSGSLRAAHAEAQAKSSAEATRRERQTHCIVASDQTPPRRIALLFAARSCDSKVSLLADHILHVFPASNAAAVVMCTRSGAISPAMITMRKSIY